MVVGDRGDDQLVGAGGVAFHVLQITSLYVGQLAPSAAITNASFFQAADELRALQRIAYRAKSLSLTHGTSLADSAVARSIWETTRPGSPGPSAGPRSRA